MPNELARLDYSGQPFGAPNPSVGTKAWRIKHGVFMPRAADVGIGTTLLGADSVSVSGLPAGLPVYAGYNHGSFNNWAALVAWSAVHSPGAHLISITPSVTVGSWCLDVEPGDATAAEAPAFFRLGSAGHAGHAKPVFYTSASDVSAVVNALAHAGVARGQYYIWSAHWIGLHICAPSVCGYPAADATQYSSNPNNDRDVFSAYMFGAPSQTPVLQLHDVDPVDGVNAVHSLQTRLNVWHNAPTGAANPEVAVDGNFGALTETAVKDFQAHEKLPVDGIVGVVTWAALDKAPPVPPPPLPDAPLELVGAAVTSKSYNVTVARGIGGYTGQYDSEIRDVNDKQVAVNVGNGAVVKLSVPGPGEYSVRTGAIGYKGTVKNVTVPVD